MQEPQSVVVAGKGRYHTGDRGFLARVTAGITRVYMAGLANDVSRDMTSRAIAAGA